VAQHGLTRERPRYFVTMRRGADGVGAAGEIENVTHVFQPSGRFSAANSL
jgi:hypothetical protein